MTETRDLHRREDAWGEAGAPTHRHAFVAGAEYGEAHQQELHAELVKAGKALATANEQAERMGHCPGCGWKRTSGHHGDDCLMVLFRRALAKLNPPPTCQHYPADAPCPWNTCKPRPRVLEAPSIPLCRHGGPINVCVCDPS